MQTWLPHSNFAISRRFPSYKRRCAAIAALPITRICLNYENISIVPGLSRRTVNYERSDGQPDFDNTQKRLASYAINLTNETSYLVKCIYGHSSAIAISLTNHELLFEVGVFAVLDGYYREAITSFAASLERFFEFAIHTIAIAEGCPHEVDNYCWKEMSSQSERQLGAYIYLYAARFKAKPPILSQKMTTLRNSAVHKGEIPTLDKAKSFGEEVLSIISKVNKQLWLTMPAAANRVGSAKSTESARKITAAGGINSKYTQQIDSAIRQNRSLEQHLLIMQCRHSANSIERHRKIVEEFSERDRVK